VLPNDVSLHDLYDDLHKDLLSVLRLPNALQPLMRWQETRFERENSVHR
jgi:hypothetical protein